MSELPAEWEEASRTRKLDNNVEIFEYGSVGDLSVHFKLVAADRPNVLKSQAAGAPVFDVREIMFISTAGDRLSKPAHIVTPDLWNNADFRRFKPFYEKWKAGLAFEGTQISEWDKATVADKASLIYQQIHTVEQFAAMSEDKVPMGFRELYQKAKQQVDAKAVNHNANNYLEQIADLRRQVEKLSAEKEAAPVEEEPVRRRGRPRKEEGTEE
jgi:hypothetical protein